MSFNHTDCVLVMGRRGCGKSYLAKGVQNIWPRRIIIDSLNEYTEEDYAGAKVVHSFHEFCEALKKLHSVSQDNFVLIYQFDIESENHVDEFNEIMRLCFYFGNIQVVVEEVQLYSTPHQLPKWLKQCLLVGRHNNLSLLFTTQRPGELNKTILSQCSHIFCGQIIEGNDLRYVSSFLNQDADRLSKIPPRRFLYFYEGRVTEISNDFKKTSPDQKPKNRRKT